MRSKAKRPADEPDPIDPAVVQVAVADGILIARSAASIAVANRIIVHALREQGDFDVERTATAVREELGRLANEQNELATRMVDARTKALKSRGRSRHQFDYRRDDNSALALREAIYSTIADELEALKGDDAYVGGIVVSARDRAWNDIGSAVLSQAGAVVVPDSGYDDARDERLRQLLEVDLAALAESASGQSPKPSSKTSA